MHVSDRFQTLKIPQSYECIFKHLNFSGTIGKAFCHMLDPYFGSRLQGFVHCKRATKGFYIGSKWLLLRVLPLSSELYVQVSYSGDIDWVTTCGVRHPSNICGDTLHGYGATVTTNICT